AHVPASRGRRQRRDRVEMGSELPCAATNACPRGKGSSRSRIPGPPPLRAISGRSDGTPFATRAFMANDSTYDTSTLALPRRDELLCFDPSGLYDKLVRLKVVGTREEGATLLREVVKYLIVSDLHPEESIPMFSSRVDEVWHQFVLFTAQYADFCA